MAEGQESKQLTVGELRAVLERLAVSDDAPVFLEREMVHEDGFYPDECIAVTVEVDSTGYEQLLFRLRH